MKDQAEFDLFLIALRAWVMESTGTSPNATSAWFRHQIYEFFPAFPLWAKSTRDYSLPLPDFRQRQEFRLVH